MPKIETTTPEQFACDLESILRRSPDGIINIEQMDKAAEMIRARDVSVRDAAFHEAIFEKQGKGWRHG